MIYDIYNYALYLLCCYHCYIFLLLADLREIRDREKEKEEEEKRRKNREDRDRRVRDRYIIYLSLDTFLMCWWCSIARALSSVGSSVSVVLPSGTDLYCTRKCTLLFLSVKVPCV